MTHRRRILKIIALSIIILVPLSTWYINTFLAPARIKNFITRSVSQAIDRPVSLKGIHLSPIKGFILEDLVIYEPDGRTRFIRVEKITTTLLIIPLLKEKRIVIPSIHIASPSISIVKNQDNTWNFLNPALLKKELVLKRSKGSQFSLFIQNIRFENGQINFLDNARSPAYDRRLINLEGNVGFSLKGVMHFKAVAKLNTQEKTDIALDGSYRLNENLLTAKTTLKNLSLLEPYNYFYKIGLVATLKSGLADLLVDLKIGRDKKFSLGVNSTVKNLDVSCLKFNLKGDMAITGNSNFDLTETFKADYKINLGLKNSFLSGIYLLNEISALNGNIEISNDGIYSPTLEGLAYNTPIRFSGGIKDFKEPKLRTRIEAALDLANYKNFLPEDLKFKFKEVDLGGPAEIDIKFYDDLKDPQPVSVEGSLRLREAALKTPALPTRIEKISGGLLYKNNILYLSRLFFNYGPQNYILDAKISDLNLPDVKMKLKTSDFSLDSRFQLKQDNLHILRASGKYVNSSFNISGDVKDFKNPNILLRGGLALDLFDLRKLLPKSADTLTRLGLAGICNLELYLNGPWKEPGNLEAVVKGHSDRIGIWDLKVDEVNLDIRLKEKNFLVPQFSARPYGGTFLSTMEMDLTQQNPPYIITLDLTGLDLNKLILDTPLKDKPMSGKALAKFNIRGFGKNLETINGEGRIYVKGGYLWELPLLRGLADVLFLPNLSTILFDEASADFVIANKNISTGNIALHSKNVSLLGQGALNFGGDIDLFITTTISEDFLKGTSEFGRLAGLLLAEAGQLMGTIKIGGTIKKPEYKFIPLPIDKILKDKLKGLLGGFF